MAQHLRIANTEVAVRRISDWATTETAQDILRSLELMLTSDQPAITMISGVSGIGKTLALKKFQKEHPFKCRYYSIKCGEKKPGDVSEILFHDLIPCKNPNGLSLPSRRELLLTKVYGGTFIFDDAHFLETNAIEWIRGFAEDTASHVAFAGGLQLAQSVGVSPELSGRLLRPVVIRKVSGADVAAVVEGTAFANPRSIESLHAVAQKRGGLRNVENVVRIATLFAGSGIPGHEHLKAAITDMKLDSGRAS